MAISYTDYTSPDRQFFFDVNKNTVLKTNNRNFFNLLGYKQLNTIGNTSLLAILLSKGHYVEPHYHQNASELVYCVTGALNVSFINPFTNKLSTYRVGPGQVANVPQGWWHFEEALEDNTYALAIFDAPIPEFILGSDILRLMPSKVMADVYCLDEAKWKEAVAPITQTVGIGPLDNCQQQRDTAQPVAEEEAEQSEYPASSPSYYYPSPPVSASQAGYDPRLGSPYYPPVPAYPYPPSPYPAYAPPYGYAQWQQPSWPPQGTYRY